MAVFFFLFFFFFFVPSFCDRRRSEKRAGPLFSFPRPEESRRVPFRLSFPRVLCEKEDALLSSSSFPLAGMQSGPLFFSLSLSSLSRHHKAAHSPDHPFLFPLFFPETKKRRAKENPRRQRPPESFFFFMPPLIGLHVRHLSLFFLFFSEAVNRRAK